MGRAKHIIFDLDGTLIDSARLTGLILDAMMVERGAADSADRALIRAMDAVGGEAMIAAVMGPHCRDPLADLDSFRARHRRVPTPADLAFPGVAEGLADLRAAGIPLAICSNKPQDLCDKILAELGLARHFAAIFGSAHGRPRKPAPDAALLALGAVGGRADDTLYIGDSPVDVVTARAAGLPVALVEWGYGTKDAIALDPGLRVFPSMAALVRCILGHDLASLPR